MSKIFQNSRPKSINETTKINISMEKKSQLSAISQFQIYASSKFALLFTHRYGSTFDLKHLLPTGND